MDPDEFGTVASIKNKARDLVPSKVKQEIMNPWTKKKNQIIMVEPFVPVMTFFMMGEILQSMKVWFHVDYEQVKELL